MNCFVPGCPNKYRNTLGCCVSFHRLPKSNYTQWLEAIGRDTTTPLSPKLVVCSVHFRNKDFFEKHQKRSLKPGVIPSQNLSRRPVEPGPPLKFQKCLTDVGPSCSFEGRKSILKKRFMNEVSSGSTSSTTGVKRRKVFTSSSPTSGNSSVKRIIRTFHSYSLLPGSDSSLKQRNRVLMDRIKVITEKLEIFRRTRAERKVKVETFGLN